MTRKDVLSGDYSGSRRRAQEEEQSNLFEQKIVDTFAEDQKGALEASLSLLDFFDDLGGMDLYDDLDAEHSHIKTSAYGWFKNEMRYLGNGHLLTRQDVSDILNQDPPEVGSDNFTAIVRFVFTVPVEKRLENGRMQTKEAKIEVLPNALLIQGEEVDLAQAKDSFDIWDIIFDRLGQINDK